MKKKWVTSSILGSLLLAGGVAAAYDAQPGSADDPLVTKSYVEQLINQRLGGGTSDAGSTASTASGGSAMSVQALTAGQKIIGSAGTEFIVRTGTVKAVAGQNGDGLPDVTEGTDIKGGQPVEANHMILIPKSDKRGLEVAAGSAKAYIMVIGQYQVVK